MLAAAVGCTPVLAARYAPHLAECCEMFGITGQVRLAAFLAQIGHESGSLRHVREIWGPTPAQARYEGRVDLGNTQPGDGSRFRGRGLIQTTGRSNYQRVRDRLRARLGPAVPDFEAEPEALEEPRWAALSAGDYWDMRRLNAVADSGDFVRLTRLINGGTNGLADRQARHARALASLASQAVVATRAAPVATASPPSPATPAPAAPTTPEVTMSMSAIPALASALLPALVKHIPMISEIFGRSPAVDDRTAKTAELVLDVVQQAVGARNAQEAVELVQAAPEARQLAEDAVRAHWFEIQAAHEASKAAARQFAQDYAGRRDVRTVAGNLTFIEVLSLIMVTTSLLGGLAVIAWADVSSELKGAIITLILIGGYSGVKEFWFGSSHGSKLKDEASRPDLQRPV